MKYNATDTAWAKVFVTDRSSVTKIRNKFNPKTKESVWSNQRFSEENKFYYSQDKKPIEDFLNLLKNYPRSSEKELLKIAEISKSNKEILQENRKMYTQSLEKIAEISKTNKNILQENRKMYTDALEKIQNTEEQNMEEIRPILNEMTENTQKLENNICDPFFSSRMFYRNWRNNSLNSNTNVSNLNGLLGMPFITGLSSTNNSINKNI